MSMQKLLKTWVLPDRTTERTQITLRLDYDLYAKLHSLKEVYKNRSVNDMVNDILKAGLEEIVESLPTYKERIDDGEIGYLVNEYGGFPEDYQYSQKGPRVEFDAAYRRLLEIKDDSPKLEAVQ
jgi:predicted CopG family antitoxin